MTVLMGMLRFSSLVFWTLANTLNLCSFNVVLQVCRNWSSHFETEVTWGVYVPAVKTQESDGITVVESILIKPEYSTRKVFFTTNRSSIRVVDMSLAC
jgi:hypothetical protein